jgi:hypothetical protein
MLTFPWDVRANYVPATAHARSGGVVGDTETGRKRRSGKQGMVIGIIDVSTRNALPAASLQLRSSCYSMIPGSFTSTSIFRGMPASTLWK